MSAQNITAKIKLRIDTSANWTSINPILLAGEIGIENDTRKFKFGDGVTAWSGLGYGVASASVSLADLGITATANEINLLDGITAFAKVATTGSYNDLNDKPASASIPSGIIVMWSGSSENIPSGWYLCNGSNGTPNLQDRFIVGAGSSYAVGATGGENSHTLSTNEMPYHRHDFGLDIKGTASTGTAIDNTNAGGYGGYIAYTSYAGANWAHENRPPYYALCYIMKA